MWLKKKEENIPQKNKDFKSVNDSDLQLYHDQWFPN